MSISNSASFQNSDLVVSEEEPSHCSEMSTCSEEGSLNTSNSLKDLYEQSGTSKNISYMHETSTTDAVIIPTPNSSPIFSNSPKDLNWREEISLKKNNESSDDDSPIIKSKFLRTKPIIISDSENENCADTDTEDDEESIMEQSTFSPSTRMSINGIPYANYVSDSDEDKNDLETGKSLEAEKDLHSIVIADSDDENNHSSIVITNEDKDALNLSERKFLKTIDQNKGASSSAKKTIQPKINQLTKTLVSKEYYNKELNKLNELMEILEKAQKLEVSTKGKLVDGGRRLSGRIDKLKTDIEKQRSYLDTLQIEIIDGGNENRVKVIDKVKSNYGVVPSWDELSAATNEIKPKYTGKVGLENFNIKKGLTMDCLKDIHGSLATAPAEHVFAEVPSGIKVDLMPHQQHALAWMEWRESLVPSGGILADDMGLGKTLTAISHVIAADRRQNNKENEYTSSEDDEDDTKSGGWSAKGRRDYYNGKTLVVCPASLLDQWTNEISTRVRRGILSVLTHHGPKRESKARHLAKHDFIVTTYNIVSREYKSNGPLFQVKWNRVILDEAHIIRNHVSQISISVCELRRKKCWVLTGTPIQNKELDVFPLLKFLKCKPFDEYSQYKRWIDNKTEGGQVRLNTLLKGLLLRRTKETLVSMGTLQDLPSKDVRVIEIKLDKDEMNVYQKILIFSKSLFAQYLHQKADDFQYGQSSTNKLKHPNIAYDEAHKKMMQLYGSKDIKSHEILLLILRLRQICCHPGLITAMLEEHDRSNVLEDSDCADSSDIDLLEQINNLKLTDDVNLIDVLEENAEHHEVGKNSKNLLSTSNPVFNFSRPTSKIRQILEVVDEILALDEKAVIVSQWAKVLDILGIHLRKRGIQYITLTGSVPVAKRGEIVKTFNSQTRKPNILLLSLTAGGIGLNLVGGNHLLLIDPHWNPQLEAQAQDRIYRMGQTKHVHIYKFIVMETIEQRIKSLQERKMAVANGILTGVKSGGSKLSMEDLKTLFDL